MTTIKSNPNRVLRGGYWDDYGRDCRSARRFGLEPGSRDFVGCRPVLKPILNTNHAKRALRGGSWYNFARYCRSAFPGAYVPGNRSRRIGFRPALKPACAPTIMRHYHIGREWAKDQEARLAIDDARNTTCRNRQIKAATIYLDKIDHSKIVTLQNIRCLKENVTFWGMLALVILSIYLLLKY